MGKKSDNMSVAMDREMQDFLKSVAAKKKSNVSKLIRELVQKYLSADDDFDTIILKIPAALKTDPDGLRKWLEVKSAAIVKALTDG